jgi:hypothetical protein
MSCGGGQLQMDCPEKANTASIPTCCNCKLVDGEEPHPFNCRGCTARHGRDAKEKVAESTQDYNGKDVLFEPHHP